MAKKTFYWPNPPTTIDTTGLATEAKQDVQIQIAQDTLTELEDFHADNSSENTAQLTETQDFHNDNSTENAAQLAAIQNVESAVTTLDGNNTFIGNAIVSAVDSLHNDNSAENAAIEVTLTAINGKVLTDTQLRASPVPVTGPLTDTQLRASPVPVSGPLTDTQLRASPVPISGTVTTGGLTDTQLRASPVPVSGTITATGPLTDTQLRASPVPTSAAQSGAWTVQPGNTANTTAWLTQQEKSATATLANVSGSTSSVTLQASSAARKGWTIHNDSASILYVKFGTTASATSYTVKLIADAYYELPTTSVYTGIITGIWVAATGAARVTELS